MEDKEKVIKQCKQAIDSGEPVMDYNFYYRVIKLLKGQEPVKPIRLENWWQCPSCSGNIVANMKYCPGCGRSVKWE